MAFGSQSFLFTFLFHIVFLFTNDRFELRSYLEQFFFHWISFFYCAFLVWILQCLRPPAWRIEKRENTQKTHNCAFSRVRTMCLFLCRCEVKSKDEDYACAVITKKGVFSETCYTQNYHICQNVISSDKDL